MVRERANRLGDLCERRAGEHLRGVFVYGDDGIEAVHIRDDVRAAYGGTELGGLLEAARRVQDVGSRVGAAGTPMGDVEAHLHAFENAFVLQFPIDDGAGIAVSFDAEAGSQLAGFIEDCLAQLES